MQIMKQIGSIEKKIRKFNAKIDNSFAWQVAEILAVSPHFHGHFVTLAIGDSVAHAGPKLRLYLDSVGCSVNFPPQSV
jgi:hypothetical protein